MTNWKRWSGWLAMAAMALLFVSGASAQATRTWISGVGDDVNPCSRTAPCKTFAGAISKTAAWGEINCLDSGGFGAVTITKPITLDCSAGLIGSILASGTTGIAINTANPLTDVVTIRNLRINGANTGVNGISITAARVVHLEHVAIFGGFTTNGVLVNTSSPSILTMEDVTISDVGANGISLNTSSGTTLAADLKDVRIWSCTVGLLGLANTNATVENAMFTNNVNAVRQNSGLSAITVTNSTLNQNTTVFQSFSTSTIRSFSNRIVLNATAFSPNGGTIFTDGQNTVAGNGANGNPNGGTISKM